MINIILCGCSGKMGYVIKTVCDEDENVKIVGGVDAFDSKDLPFPVFSDFKKINTESDVIIDFSNPSTLDGLLEYASDNKKPVVIATTGFDEEQIEKIHSAAKKIPVFFTFNMSIGINLMIELAKSAAKVLGNDFDIEIIEKHHNQKIDAPSGTAIMLADAVSEELESKPFYEYDRHSKREKRPKDEIGIHSVRGGTIVGEHEVIFAGNDEIISIKHQAMSKKIFACGSINAAKFLCGKPAGLYSMKNMID